MGSVVQLPTVIVEIQLHLARRGPDLLAFISGEIADEEADLAAAPLVEVVLEPVHDLRRMQDQSPALLLRPDAVGAVEELPGLIVELLGELGSDVGLGPDRRTALGGAVDGEVDARVLEPLAD